MPERRHRYECTHFIFACKLSGEGETLDRNSDHALLAVQDRPTAISLDYNGATHPKIFYVPNGPLLGNSPLIEGDAMTTVIPRKPYQSYLLPKQEIISVTNFQLHWEASIHGQLCDVVIFRFPF